MLFLLALAPSVFAASSDIGRSEDSNFYQAVDQALNEFRKKHRSLPTTWVELGMPIGCAFYNIKDRKYYPQTKDQLNWRPANCTLTYRYERLSASSYKVSAFAAGHVVSTMQNGKTMFLKTRYFPRANPTAPKGVVY